MKHYMKIAQISDLFVRRLRGGLIPEVLEHPGQVRLIHPAERGEAAVTIYLYNIERNRIVHSSQMVQEGTKTQRYPPGYYDFYYMITAWSDSDEVYRSMEEQHIFGRIMQVLSDYPELGGGADNGRDAARPAEIQMMPAEEQDRVKLWSSLELQYRLSLYYKVGPVELASDKTKDVTRVSDVDLDVGEMEG